MSLPGGHSCSWECMCPQICQNPLAVQMHQLNGTHPRPQQEAVEGTELTAMGAGRRRDLRRIALLLPGELFVCKYMEGNRIHLEVLSTSSFGIFASQAHCRLSVPLPLELTPCCSLQQLGSGLDPGAGAGGPGQPNHCPSFAANLTPCCAAYSNSGVASTLALVVVALANPSLLALPHACALLVALWRWAGGRRAGSAAWRALQVYTGEATSSASSSATSSIHGSLVLGTSY